MPDPVNSTSDDDSESYGEDGDDSESYGENGDDSESYGENADDEDSQGDLSTKIRRPKRQRRPPERYTAGASLALKATPQLNLQHAVHRGPGQNEYPLFLCLT
jgi:hypothetical protein